MPRVVVLTLDAARPPHLAALRWTLSAAAAGATLDDHRRWVERLAAMANTIVALGLGVVALVIAATGLAGPSATRGAMAGNREIVEVLHLVGASDGFIAGEFQRRFFTLGLHGGAIGGAAALLAFVLAGTLSAAWTATPEADQIEALFGSFSLGVPGLLAIVGIAALVAAVTALVSRLTVRRTLREIG